LIDDSSSASFFGSISRPPELALDMEARITQTTLADVMHIHQNKELKMRNEVIFQLYIIHLLHRQSQEPYP
jgi:hypothetical protein